MQRRIFLRAALLVGAMPTLALAKTDKPVIEVYKSATCGCCTQWIEHLQANGFKVNAQNVPNTAAYRTKLGVPPALGSCHTGTIGGYALEGHVPAADIKRLLAEKPKAKGLAVPGMPMGSPGMEVPGEPADAYDVLLFQADGKTTVYRHYAAK
ncbi:MAG: DUF411 domain-containing protein [Herminiimonas sp.]|uniref:DUF411 domain-containing protein n=1 Tax=Herminiimonas sp. TaxID=1926289 RepID=UPI0027234C3A|nr:DUF411 domain-containing protein [Herminiimonas sp.]MDO9421796.1 DUF411 domain-containing protein [Herminiimonas sp.]MDO9421849.1 DUF411 domain-containing protein [Herminiimonas sp.]